MFDNQYIHKEYYIFCVESTQGKRIVIPLQCTEHAIIYETHEILAHLLQ